MQATQKAVVIGAGPAGLAAAACLKRAGLAPVILEQAGTVAASWRSHYDGLCLHTTRARSALPFRPMPAHFGRYPTRAQVLDYFDSYAAQFDFAPQFETEVTAIAPDPAGWRVTWDGGARTAPVVVVSTGLNRVPRFPDVAGLGSFSGKVLHASDYRSAEAFAGQSVLIVGFGNSGGDIAVELAAVGAKVTVSVRGAVNIVPRDLFGMPITSLGLLRKLLGYKLADRLTAPVLRAVIGRASDYGFAEPGKGPLSQLVEDGKVPLIDHGALAAIHAGQVTVRPDLRGISGATVTFTDGSAMTPDSVIFATGYDLDLRPLLGRDSAALDACGCPRATGAPGPLPGLYFCALKASPEGQLRQAGLDARAIAADAAESLSSKPRNRTSPIS